MPKKASTKKVAPKKAPAVKLSKKPLFVGQPPHKPTPPPPPAKRLPPPPPKRPVAPTTPAQAIPELPKDSVLRQLAEMPEGATHIQYHRESFYDKAGTLVPGVTIVVPLSCGGDFSSFKTGTVSYGRLRYGDTFVPVGEQAEAVAQAPAPVPGKRLPPPPPGRASAPVVATNCPAVPKQPGAAGPKREGVCAFIDNLIMEGGRTREQIRDLVIAQFPGRDPKATMTTIGIRPTHIRAKGQTPPPFAK